MVHERNRSATESRVQLHFPRATRAPRPSAAADPHDGGRNPEAAVAQFNKMHAKVGRGTLKVDWILP